MRFSSEINNYLLCGVQVHGTIKAPVLQLGVCLSEHHSNPSDLDKEIFPWTQEHRTETTSVLKGLEFGEACIPIATDRYSHCDDKRKGRC